MADVGLALERAENKTEEMKARAEAIDELMEAALSRTSQAAGTI